MMITGIGYFTPLKAAQNFKAAQKQKNSAYNDEEIKKLDNEIKKISNKLEMLKRLHQEESPEYIKLNGELKTLYKQIAILENDCFKFNNN